MDIWLLEHIRHKYVIYAPFLAALFLLIAGISCYIARNPSDARNAWNEGNSMYNTLRLVLDCILSPR